MIKKLESRFGWAILLIGAGILMLLQNFRLIARTEEVFFGILFAVVGIFFLAMFSSDRTKWWATLPGFLFPVIGATIAFPRMDNVLSSLIPAAIGLSFLTRYIADRKQWWGVLVGGVLVSVSATVLAEELNIRLFDDGLLILFGMGLTFGVLYLLPVTDGEKRRKWAVYPAIGLVVLGIIVTAAESSFLNYFWAIGLIGVGLYLALASASATRPAGDAEVVDR